MKRTEDDKYLWGLLREGMLDYLGSGYEAQDILDAKIKASNPKLFQAIAYLEKIKDRGIDDEIGVPGVISAGEIRKWYEEGGTIQAQEIEARMDQHAANLHGVKVEDVKEYYRLRVEVFFGSLKKD